MSETMSARYASLLPIIARPLMIYASARVLLILARITVDVGLPQVGPQECSSMWEPRGSLPWLLDMASSLIACARTRE